MATIEERLQNVRTLEDIVYLLTILFTNLNNQNKIYYDMFLNPTPMDLELERYDENGELVKVTLANRAKDRIWILTGEGNPNGRVAAKAGTIYMDLAEEDAKRSLYFKSTDNEEDTGGWQLIYSKNNISASAVFPDGTAGDIKVNAENIEGILSVPQGGTGTARISEGSIVQGHNQDPFTAYNLSDITALLNDFVGMIMYSPIDNITGNWLICDGTEYDITERPELTNLLNKIGNKYGGNGVTTFCVPNLIDKYVKCGDENTVGNTGEGQVKAHNHELSGSVNSESSHKHDKGTFNIEGNFQTSGNNTFSGYGIPKGEEQAFYAGSKIGLNMAGTYGISGLWHAIVKFSAARRWTGLSGSGSPHTHTLTGLSTKNSGSEKNEVDHTVLIPVIRY